jgi:hypothetical protein
MAQPAPVLAAELHSINSLIVWQGGMARDDPAEKTELDERLQIVGASPLIDARPFGGLIKTEQLQAWAARQQRSSSVSFTAAPPRRL